MEKIISPNYKFIEDLVLPEPIKQPKIMIYTCNYNNYDFNIMGRYPFCDSIILEDSDYKYKKIHSCEMFPDYDYTIYLDANIKLKLSPIVLIRNILLDDLLLVRNGLCIYQNDNRHDYLREKGLPVGKTSYKSNFIVRRNCAKIIEFEKCWEEVGNIGLAVYLMGMNIKLIDEEKLFFETCHRKVIVPIIWGGSDD